MLAAALNLSRRFKSRGHMMNNAFVRIGGLRYRSLQEGPGRRTVLWFAGCSLGCVGCINPQLWPAESGQATSLPQAQELLAQGREQGDCGVTFVGGEPFDQPEALAALCEFVANTWPAASHPPRLIVYSGYTWEALAARTSLAIDRVLAHADVLIDGPFINALKDPNLGYRGSANQRVIDLPRTRATGVVQVLNWDRPHLNILPDGTVTAAPDVAGHLKLDAVDSRHCGQLNSAVPSGPALNIRARD